MLLICLEAPKVRGYKLRCEGCVWAVNQDSLFYLKSGKTSLSTFHLLLSTFCHILNKTVPFKQADFFLSNISLWLFFLSFRIVWSLPYESLLTSKHRRLFDWAIKYLMFMADFTSVTLLSGYNQKQKLLICPWLALNRYEISFCFLKWLLLPWVY